MADMLLSAITDTWNSASTDFVAFGLTVSDVASGAGARLVDFKVNGNQRFSVDKLGNLIAAGNIAGVAGTFSGPLSAPSLALSTALPIASGGTGGKTSAEARSALGLAIGSNVQAYDFELTALAALTSAANKLPYFSGLGTAALADFSAFARTILDDTSAAAVRATIELGNVPNKTEADMVGSGAIADALAAKASTTALSSGLAGKVNTSAVGAASGVASLDANGKVPISQLSDSVIGNVNWIGTWNASTNSPAIPAAAASNKGQYRIVQTAGATNINGITDWKVGDWIISNGSVWEKVDNTDQVMMVAGRVGNIILVAADISDSGATGRSLMQDATPTAAREHLELGSLAVKSQIATADVPDSSITLPKLPNIGVGSFLARRTAGTGNVETITAAQAKVLLALENLPNKTEAQMAASGAIADAIAAAPKGTAIRGSQSTATSVGTSSVALASADFTATGPACFAMVNASVDGNAQAFVYLRLDILRISPASTIETGEEMVILHQANFTDRLIAQVDFTGLALGVAYRIRAFARTNTGSVLMGSFISGLNA